MQKIRLGMVRCDGHAYTFGPLMVPCNVAIFREHFHAEYYWMINAYQPNKLKTPRVGGFEIVKVYDCDRGKAEHFAEMLFGKPHICRSLEDVATGIDAVFINDCNGDGSDHLKLCRPFLKSGIPTFIDKPFASRLKQAKAIVRLARLHGAPLYSSSILREVNEIKHLKARLPEIKGQVAMGVIKGVGGHLGAAIHGLSLAQGFFGTGVESVQCIGDRELEHLLLEYRNGVQIAILNTPASCFDWFTCTVYTNPGKYMNPPLACHLRSNCIGDSQYIGGAINVIRKFRRMVRTQELPVPYEALVELIAIVDAGRLSQKTGKRVYLREIS